MDTEKSQFTKKVPHFVGEDGNILNIILEDHRLLKELINTMKDPELPLPERTRAFAEFAPLLLTHAKAEEKSLYELMKQYVPTRADAFEGITEHAMADQLCEEIKRTTDHDQLSAMIKVLAEAVEHHLEEEENDVFPEVRENIGEATLVDLTKLYVRAQSEIISQGQTDSPRESEIHTPHAPH